MAVKIFEIIIKNKPVYVGAVRDYDSRNLAELKRECEKNLNDLLNGYENKIDELNKKVEQLTKKIKHLEGED